jgi:acyl-CoA thioesterase FadM
LRQRAARCSRALGQPLLAWQGEGFAFPVIEVRLRYQRPARYDDELEIMLWLMRLDRHAELRLRDPKPAGEAILEGDTRHVCATLEEKPRRPHPTWWPC